MLNHEARRANERTLDAARSALGSGFGKINKRTRTEMTTTRTYKELQALVNGLYKKIAEAAASGKDISEFTSAYVQAKAELQKAQETENAGRINLAKSALANGIKKLIESSGLEKLLGTPVTTVGWKIETPEGESAPVMTLLVNPKAITRRAKGTATGGGKGRKSVIFNIEGTDYDSRAAADKYANDEERKHSHFLKWPTELLRSTIGPRLKAEGKSFEEKAKA